MDNERPEFDLMAEPEEQSRTPGDIMKGIQGAMANYGKGGFQPYVEIMSPKEWEQRSKKAAS